MNYSKTITSGQKIKQSSFLNSLPTNVISDWSDYDTLDYSRGEELFIEGSTPKGVYVIEEGMVKITKLGCDGKEQILKLGRSDDYLGYKALLSGNRYSTSAIAVEPTTVYFLPKSEYLTLLSERPKLLQNMLLQLTNDTSTIEKRMVEMAYTPVRGRMISALLKLSVKGEDGKDHITNLTRMELANIVGTATETLIRMMKELKDEGILSVQGRQITIEDRNKLEALNRQYY